MGAMAISDARLELAGVYTHFSPKAISFAATDVFRLAECSVSVKATSDHGVIIPRGTITELARIAGEIEGIFEIRIGDNQISYTTSDIELVSRLIDGKYPDYKRVIPEKFVKKVLIEHGALEQAARLAGLFSSSISDIKLSGENKTLTITAHNTDKGEIQVAVPATIKGELFEVSLNFHYLLDGLKAVRSEKIVLEFTGQGSPFVIKPESQTKDSVYLIMPLRS